MNDKESIKVIDDKERKKDNQSDKDINVSLPEWDINPPFELLDRSEQ